jgi:hypothetical protein
VVLAVRFIFMVMALGLANVVSGAEELSAPDAVATRIEALLQGKYMDDAGTDRVIRVLEIEKRLGAYRAAANRAEFIRRITADLHVATGDQHICVREQTAPPDADTQAYDLGTSLKLILPGARDTSQPVLPDVR